jgi:hypothetical protein
VSYDTTRCPSTEKVYLAGTWISRPNARFRIVFCPFCYGKTHSYILDEPNSDAADFKRP